MKKNLTELVFILDRSGSMSGLENDTIGGFNAMLKEQKSVAGEAFVTTVLFSDQYEVLHDRIDIRKVEPLTENDYSVRGNTALLDAVGKTIHNINEAQKYTAENDRAEKVLFVIITDGQENASCEYSAERIKARIERQKEKYGWEFVFFGANMDAVMEAGKLGIGAGRAKNYCADAVGTNMAYTAMSAFSTAFRGGKPFDGLSDPKGDDLKPENNSPNDAIHDEFKAALTNLKAAVGGAKGAANKLADVFGDIVKAAEANNGKIRDVNDIARQVLEDELKELEENSGDEARINELRDILKQ